MMALDRKDQHMHSLSATSKQRSRAGEQANLGAGNDVPPPQNFNFGGGNGVPDPFSEACGLVQVNMAAYHDSELDEDTYRAVDTHIAHCNRCSAMLSAMQETDRLIEWEWREYQPLPSSSEVSLSIDNIMSALPPAADAAPQFAPKRIHSRARWMRFSTGVVGILVLFSLLWTSYKLGYSRGTQITNYEAQPSDTLSTSFSSAQSASVGSTEPPSDISSSIKPTSSIPRTSSNTSSAVINRMHL